MAVIATHQLCEDNSFVFLLPWQLFTEPCFYFSPFSCWQAQDGKTAFEQGGAGVRGPRIVEHKSPSSCQSEKNWPFCADDDWVSHWHWGERGASAGSAAGSAAGSLHQVPQASTGFSVRAEVTLQVGAACTGVLWETKEKGGKWRQNKQGEVCSGAEWEEKVSLEKTD